MCRYFNIVDDSVELACSKSIIANLQDMSANRRVLWTRLAMVSNILMRNWVLNALETSAVLSSHSHLVDVLSVEQLAIRVNEVVEQGGMQYVTYLGPAIGDKFGRAVLRRL